MDGNTAENLTKEPAAGCFGRIVAPPLIAPYLLTFAFSGFPLGAHTKLLRQAGLDAEVEADGPDGRGEADAEAGGDGGRAAAHQPGRAFRNRARIDDALP